MDDNSRGFLSKCTSTLLTVAIVSSVACVAPMVPVVPAGPPGRVLIRPPRPDSQYAVMVRDAAGQQQQCAPPCELRVTSGTAYFQTLGDREMQFGHVLQTGSVLVQLRERNNVLFGIGIGAVALGLLTVIGGLAVVADGDRGSGGPIMGSASLISLSGALMLLLSGTNSPQFTDLPAGNGP